MKGRVAINGFGRIGRCVLRALYEYGYRSQLEIIAINDVADNETMAYLTKYDTVHGRFPGRVSLDQHTLSVGEDKIFLLTENNIENLPWKALGIDIVLECTGLFGKRADAVKHLDSGSRKVLFSYPASQDVDFTVVYGINHNLLKSTYSIVSNASCTTNCLIPILKIIDDEFTILNGSITTIHSSMNDQPVNDAYHHTDLRKTRSAGQSIIPVDTELARGIGRIFPHLDGKLKASAVRVPVANVSAMDIVLLVDRNTDELEVNHVFREASKGYLSGILGFSEEPLTSSDFNHDSRSSVIDSTQTKVSGGNLIKIFAWFDNEWAYSVRMLDSAIIMLDK